MKTFLLASLTLFVSLFTAQTFAASQIRIMHYNVENLFDAVHDQGKDDWEFLPANFPGRNEACAKQPQPWMVQACLANDWTDAKVELKLNQIAKVVQSSGPQRPDMMSIVEVENDALVKRLANKLGFKEFVVTQSPDNRGIDVALMFNQSPKLRLVKAERIGVPAVADPIPTRDILKVTFKTGTKNLIVYVNHWPSQGAPATVRKAVAEVLMNSVYEELHKGSSVISMGDYNVISEDRPDPFYEVVQNQSRPFYLMDVQSTLKAAAKDLKVDMSLYPAGTYFFGGGFAWNMLDRFFVSPDMIKAGPIQVDLRSFQILNPPFLTAPYTIRRGPQAGSVINGAPHAYDHNAVTPETAGYSDHFPILVNLVVP